jgi:hypothetical protein
MGVMAEQQQQQVKQSAIPRKKEGTLFIYQTKQRTEEMCFKANYNFHCF